MKRIQRWLPLSIFSLTFFGIAFYLNSCATLNSLVGVTRAQFKLNDAVGYRLSGIDVMNKRSIKDFSIMDGLNLANSFAVMWRVVSLR